jgi:hypothetical protein
VDAADGAGKHGAPQLIHVFDGRTRASPVKAVDKLIREWRDAKVPLNVGASPQQLEQLREALGVPLPQDVARYFSLADGMVDPGMDRHLGNFWSIGRILSERVVRDGADNTGTYRDTAFADVLINSWFFWFRVRPGRGLSVRVDSTAEEVPSFEGVCERYVERPESLALK